MYINVHMYIFVNKTYIYICVHMHMYIHTYICRIDVMFVSFIRLIDNVYEHVSLTYVY